jgi:hypothetical protein
MLRVYEYTPSGHQATVISGIHPAIEVRDPWPCADETADIAAIRKLSAQWLVNHESAGVSDPVLLVKSDR